LIGLLVVNGNTGDVTGEHIRGELNAIEYTFHGARKAPCQHGFPHSGHIFDEHMPLTKQADYHQFDRLPFSDNNIFKAVNNPFTKRFYIHGS
jgi:hypothetical protein